MTPSNATQKREINGRFSDGITARSGDVRVALGATGVEIYPAGGGDAVLWPYATLRTNEPVRRLSIDVLVSSTLTDGATLFVPDATFAAELVAQAPHLGTGAERWRNARPWLAAAACLTLFAGTIYLLDLSPARAIATLLPNSWRDTLGTAVVSSMVSGKQDCIAPDGRTALDALVRRLTPPGGETFEVKVVDWQLLNAFAAPGGKIVLTRGLIEKADTPDEVAGVLSHEMGHAIRLHPESSVIRAIGFTAAIEIMTGGSSGTIANIGVLLAQLGYTRAAEREADIVGLELMRKSAVSPKGLGVFFRRVMKEDGSADTEKALRAISILRTHPATADRMVLIEQQAAYDSTPSLSPADWQRLKTICATLAPKADTAGK